MPEANITKQALARTLKELMAREPFAKISVGDICGACGMSRKSFYYHFRDKYDLVNWIFNTEFIQSVQAAGFQGGWDLLTAMCGYFYGERDFYRAALRIEGQNSFRDYFCEVLKPFAVSIAEDHLADAADVPFYTIFLTDALLASAVRWLTGGAPMPPEEYLRHMRHLLLGLAKLAEEELEDLPEQDT